MYFDPVTHAMICSRCFHINEYTSPVCVKCQHDAGTPVLKENAENLRNVHRRLLGGGGPDPDAVAKFDAFFEATRSTDPR